MSRRLRQQQISVGRTKRTSPTHNPCGSSGNKLRGGSASAVVTRCEHGGNSDGRDTRLELECINRGCTQDYRPLQLLALERRLRDLQCNSAEESGDVIRGAWERQSGRDQEGCTPKRDQGGATPGFYPAKNPNRYEVRQTKMGDRRLGTS